jgi:lysophospholipase L1-like esterase
MMKRAFKTILLSVLPLVLSLSWAGAGEYFFRDGDRVVFLGDSITGQRLYTTYIEAYALTRNPEWKLTFRNVGWGGDTAWLRQRAHPDERRLFAADDSTRESMVKDAVGRGLQRDVLPLKPTAVTVKFGMNDHSYQPFREDIFKAYVRSQTEIADVLKENGARVAFLTPQPIEDKRPDPDKDVKNQSLRKFSDGLKEVAAKENALFVDQFDPFMKILLRERVDNPPTFIGGGGDAVHPGPAGHLVMAWVVLKGLGAGQLVSRAEIDCIAKDGKAKGCKITNLKIGDGTVSFDRLDDALPMPVDDRATAALKLAPILEELSRYELKIDGLAAGSYELTIDSEAAGKFTAEELAKGCNLATQAGPITKQAGQVLSLVFKKNDVYFNRWRQVQLYDFPEWARIPETEKCKTQELDKLDKQVADLEAQINQARKPVQRRFELKKSAG